MADDLRVNTTAPASELRSFDITEPFWCITLAARRWGAPWSLRVTSDVRWLRVRRRGVALGAAVDGGDYALAGQHNDLELRTRA